MAPGGPDGTLRRRKSLKNLVSDKWSKRERREEEDEVPPLRSIKPSFIQLHVTSDDLAIARSSHALRVPSHRNTWPTSLNEKRPGSYEFDLPPTLVRTPWELERGRRPPSQWSRKSSDRRSLHSNLFEQLPREIISCILEKLPMVHSSGPSIDARSLQRDLWALSLINKRWHRVARDYLYRDIWAPSDLELRQKSALPFHRRQSRLRLLLRSLEESSTLADTVRHIRVTADLALELESETRGRDNTYGKYSITQFLSDIISKCQNLETFSGYAPAATDASFSLLAALSRCSQLKSHVWNLRPEGTGFNVAKLLSSPTNWTQMLTLALWQGADGCSLRTGTVNAVVQRLPALKQLYVKGLPPTDFHNGTLLMLPALKSLRLEDLHGITDSGLEQLQHSRIAMSLENLTLCGIELTSLRTIKTLLASLSRLQRFTLQQYASPELPQWYAASSSSFSLQSASLKYLCWDLLVPGHATTILANSIAAGRIPSLRKVKVPCDYDGAIQNLCRPLPLQPISNGDLATLEESEACSRYERSLRVSQIQAQLRVRERRRQPTFRVVIQDEDDAVQHERSIGSYIGSMGSEIEYSLEPAIEGAEHAIAQVEDVARPWKAGRNQHVNGSQERIIDTSVLF